MAPSRRARNESWGNRKHETTTSPASRKEERRGGLQALEEEMTVSRKWCDPEEKIKKSIRPE